MGDGNTTVAATVFAKLAQIAVNATTAARLDRIFNKTVATTVAAARRTGGAHTGGSERQDIFFLTALSDIMSAMINQFGMTQFLVLISVLSLMISFMIVGVVFFCSYLCSCPDHEEEYETDSESTSDDEGSDCDSGESDTSRHYLVDEETKIGYQYGASSIENHYLRTHKEAQANKLNNMQCLKNSWTDKSKLLRFQKSCQNSACGPRNYQSNLRNNYELKIDASELNKLFAFTVENERLKKDTEKVANTLDREQKDPGTCELQKLKMDQQIY